MPPPGACPAGNRVGRGHERVAPVVEVQERALGALEQHVLAAAKRGLDQPRRVVEVRLEPLAPAGGALDERLDLEGVRAHRAEDQVLVRQRAGDALAQDRTIEQVLHAQPQSPRPVAIRRADATSRRPHLRARQPRLVRLIQGHVVRHDHVRAATDPDAVRRDAARGEHVELGDEGHGIDHDAVADERRDVRVEHTRRRQLELEDLVAAHDGVPGVVAALVAHDHGGLLGQEIGRLALALVAPLQPDDHRSRHQRLVPRIRSRGRPDRGAGRARERAHWKCVSDRRSPATKSWSSIASGQQKSPWARALGLG